MIFGMYASTEVAWCARKQAPNKVSILQIILTHAKVHNVSIIGYKIADNIILGDNFFY